MRRTMTDNNCEPGSETTSRITVGGMTCGHCVMVVKKAIETVSGVKEASVDLEAGIADIRHNCEDGIEERFSNAVTEAGYTVIV